MEEIKNFVDRLRIIRNSIDYTKDKECYQLCKDLLDLEIDMNDYILRNTDDMK